MVKINQWMANCQYTTQNVLERDPKHQSRSHLVKIQCLTSFLYQILELL